MHSIKVDDILLDIAGCQKPWNSAIYTRQKETFQKRTADRVLKALRVCPPVERIRQNLDRWMETAKYENKNQKLGRVGGIRSNSRIASDRAHKNLERLRCLVPPRVCASVLHTLFDGWTTGSRFQKKEADACLDAVLVRVTN